MEHCHLCGVAIQDDPHYARDSAYCCGACAEREADLLGAYRALQDGYLATVHALTAATEARDPYTQGHSRRAADLAARVAAELDLAARAVELVRRAGLLHDIGKIAVPDRILHKAGPLSDEEFALIRAHSETGAAILATTPFMADLVPLVRHHHERYDGAGYPAGLEREQIPLGARILAVVDAYDAMTSRRPYRAALAPGTALTEIGRGAGGQFDPVVAAALVPVLRHYPADVLDVSLSAMS